MAEQMKEDNNSGEKEGAAVPVCIRCFQPVDPRAHYCPNCGAKMEGALKGAEHERD